MSHAVRKGGSNPLIFNHLTLYWIILALIPDFWLAIAMKQITSKQGSLKQHFISFCGFCGSGIWMCVGWVGLAWRFSGQGSHVGATAPILKAEATSPFMTQPRNPLSFTSAAFCWLRATSKSTHTKGRELDSTS